MIEEHRGQGENHQLDETWRNQAEAEKAKANILWSYIYRHRHIYHHQQYQGDLILSLTKEFVSPFSSYSYYSIFIVITNIKVTRWDGESASHAWEEPCSRISGGEGRSSSWSCWWCSWWWLWWWWWWWFCQRTTIARNQHNCSRASEGAIGAIGALEFPPAVPTNVSIFLLRNSHNIMFISSQFPPGLPTDELSLWVPALCRHLTLVRFSLLLQILPWKKTVPFTFL